MNQADNRRHGCQACEKGGDASLMARKRHGLEVRIREGRVDIGEVRLGIVGSWVRKGVNLFGFWRGFCAEGRDWESDA